MVKSLEMYILIFFTYSFLGWFMESVGGILKEKKFINRGFLIGPYCPVYGTGVVLITYLLEKYINDIPVLFVLSTVICGTLEYATSYFMEKLFNARWWDYTNRRFNINGRICLETLVPFGIAGTTIICVINPFLVNIYQMLPTLALQIIAYTLVGIFIVDSIVSFTIISSFKKETYQSKDNTEEISNMVKEKTEDMLEKAESDFVMISKKIKLGELKLQRKAHYTRKKLYSNMKNTPKELAMKLEKRRKVLREKLQSDREKFDNTIEEVTKQIRERFKSKSILKSRLIDAFPNLKINQKKQNKN